MKSYLILALVFLVCSYSLGPRIAMGDFANLRLHDFRIDANLQCIFNGDNLIGSLFHFKVKSEILTDGMIDAALRMLYNPIMSDGSLGDARLVNMDHHIHEPPKSHSAIAGFEGTIPYFVRSDITNMANVTFVTSGVYMPDNSKFSYLQRVEIPTCQ